MFGWVGPGSGQTLKFSNQMARSVAFGRRPIDLAPGDHVSLTCSGNSYIVAQLHCSCFPAGVLGLVTTTSLAKQAAVWAWSVFTLRGSPFGILRYKAAFCVPWAPFPALYHGEDCPVNFFSLCYPFGLYLNKMINFRCPLGTLPSHNSAISDSGHNTPWTKCNKA